MTLPPHDPNKRRRTLEDRNLDLVEMAKLLDGRPSYTVSSNRNGEERFVTVAEWDGKLCAVVWMVRDDMIRIITARRCHDSEEREFDRLGLQRSIDVSPVELERDDQDEHEIEDDLER